MTKPPPSQSEGEKSTSGSSRTAAAAAAGGIGRSTSYAAIATVAIVAAIFAHGINNTSSLNGIFPIVIDAIQAIGSAILGTATPRDDAMFKYGQDGLPLCNDCHCTPGWDEDPATFECPTDPPPPWKYDASTIDELHSHEANNPLLLHCNPYDDEMCDTVPSLQRGDDTVCGLVYDYELPETEDAAAAAVAAATQQEGCPLSNYTIKTFRDEDEARTAKAVVTHLGHCGVCSTTKDLAAYMTHIDMVAEGRRCTNRALLSREWGRRCYEDLGFTTPCATIWAHNSINTATICRATCVRHLFSPANGPEPECKLNDCLHCDEIESGPNFQLFAGRTRRNSGLRTPIMRQCHGFAGIQHEACPMGVVLGESEATPSTPSSEDE